MPTNRTRRLRQWQGELDEYRIVSLMNGPDDVLLAGHGYFPPPRGGFPAKATPEQTSDALAEMQRDWAVHGERLLRWWIFDENPPPMKPWTFVGTPNPKSRPWAWWEFHAPEPLRDGESEFEFLERHGLLLLGEAELPTWDERQAAQQAAIEAEIEANLSHIGDGYE